MSDERTSVDDAPRLDELLAQLDPPPPPPELVEKILAAGEEPLRRLAAGMPGEEAAMGASTLSRMVSWRRLLLPTLLALGGFALLVQRFPGKLPPVPPISPASTDPELLARRAFHEVRSAAHAAEKAGETARARVLLAEARRHLLEGDLPARSAHDLHQQAQTLEGIFHGEVSPEGARWQVTYFRSFLEDLAGYPDTPNRNFLRVRAVYELAEALHRMGDSEAALVEARKVPDMARKLKRIYSGDYLTDPTSVLRVLIYLYEKMDRPLRAEREAAIQAALEITADAVPRDAAERERADFLEFRKEGP